MNEKRKEVIEKLLAKIHSGEIVAGDKLLPERKLAEVIDETRPVLREGLIALEAMGVLDIRDRQGIYLLSSEENEAKSLLQKVRGWPADMLSRAMELRQIIEPPATALAAARRNKKDLKKLHMCLMKLKPLAGESDTEAVKLGVYWNGVFHTVIVESTDNAYLSRIYESVHTTVEQGIYLMRNSTSPEEQGGRKITYQDHENLYNAILEGDPQKAKAIAKEHLRHSIIAMVRLGQITPSSNLFGEEVRRI